MIKQIKYEDEAKKKLAEGIRTLCKVLSSDGNVLVNGKFSVSSLEIGRKIKGKDLWIRQGIRLATGTIGEINEKTGCGTKEAAKMIASMLVDCQTAFAAGENPVILAKKLKKVSLYTENCLLKKVHPMKSSERELLYEITKDGEETELILKALSCGKPIVKESVSAKTKLEVTEGMCLEQPILIGEEAVIHHAYILITDRIISSFSDLLPILEKLNGQVLFLVAEDIVGEAKILLNTNVKQGRIKVWAVKAPGYGRRKQDLLEDLASLTQTRVNHEIYPGDLADLNIDALGKTKKIQIFKQHCIVNGSIDKMHEEMIEQRISAIQQRLDNPEVNYYDKQKLSERIAWLSGKAPVLYAGGQTLSESKERER